MYNVTIEHDICYATAGGEALCLDIYRPEISGKVPVVLYLHGGGWARGDKRDNSAERMEKMAALGVAVASANYRLIPDHIYPANVHDTKAAIRWLRAHGASRSLGVDSIGVWGASAGGYLATMAGLTAGNEELEGTVGEHLDQSSAVQAVVTWFSIHDLMTFNRQSPLEQRLQGKTLAAGLFGVDEITQDNETVKKASPLRHVKAGAPPFLIAHGDCDSIVQASESANLLAGFSREGLDATFCLIAAAGHEDPKFDSASNLAMTAAWLSSKLGRA